MVRKASVTRAVFMALLKDARWRGVLAPLPAQPYADGTVFAVHDVRTLCAILMRAHALACAGDPARLQRDAHEVACFLDRALALAQSGGSARLAGAGARSCPPWLCLRNSIKEANVQPMALVARNAGLPQAAPDKRKLDWYARKVGCFQYALLTPARRSGAWQGGCVVL